jgi:hypothetical protein
MAPPPESVLAHHRLFLLRLWREEAGAPWRAILREANSQARVAFPDVEALALFLLQMADAGDGQLEAGQSEFPESLER